MSEMRTNALDRREFLQTTVAVTAAAAAIGSAKADDAAQANGN